MTGKDGEAGAAYAPVITVEFLETRIDGVSATSGRSSDTGNFSSKEHGRGDALRGLRCAG